MSRQRPLWPGLVGPTTRWLLAVLAVLAIELWVLCPGLTSGTQLPTTHETFGSSDLLDVALPLGAHTARRLHALQFPAWFPGSFLGLPLGSIPEAIPWYPLWTPWFLAFSAGRATAWVLTLHFALAGLGTALLARRLGVRTHGAVLAALVTAGGLWLPAHARQVNLVLTAAWLPWIWWSLEGVLRGPTARRAVLLGLFVGLSLLAGHVQMTHHAAVVLAVWLALRWALAVRTTVRPTGPRVGRTALALTAAAALALLLGSPHLVPVAELAARGARANTFLTGMDRMPMHPRLLLSLLSPRIIGPTASPDDGAPTAWWEQTSYVGLLPLALAVLGMAYTFTGRRRREEGSALAWVTALSLVLACATASHSLAAVAIHIPGMRLFRFESRFLWPFTVSLALWAGHGLDGAWAWLRRRSRRARYALVLGVLCLTVIDLRAVVSPLCPTGDWHPLLAEPTLSRVLRGLRPDAQHGRVLNLAPLQADAYLGHIQGWGARPEVLADYRVMLIPQHATLFGWSTLKGYVGLTSPAIRRFIGDQHFAGRVRALELRYFEHRDPAVLDALLTEASLLDVRWVTCTEPLTHPRLTLVHVSPSRVLPVYAYRLRALVTPAYFVSSPAPDSTVLPADPTIHTVSDRPEAMTVTADHAAGYLALPIAYHPRWRASVDGGPWTTVPTAGDLLLVVPWPAGRHTLRVCFDDRRDRVLVALGGFTLAVALGFVWAPRRRRGRA